MIDCHVHFSGSIPVKFLWHTIRERGWTYLAGSEMQVREAVEYDGKHGFDGFLNKFKLFDEIVWDEKLLIESIKAVSDQLMDHNIDFVWLDFSINKYLHTIPWHKIDLMNLFHYYFEKYAPGRVALVLSIKMESLEASRKQYLELIEHTDVQNNISGIDLVGDEQYFDANFYRPYLRKWADHGKMVRVHVGEVGRVSNVRDALEILPITNIAHGIDIIKDDYLVDLALKRGVQFDLALSSNLMIRHDLNINNHPIHDMMSRGLTCTLGSDDPTIFKTTLRREYDYIIDITKQKILRDNAIRFVRKYLNQYEV